MRDDSMIHNLDSFKVAVDLMAIILKTLNNIRQIREAEIDNVPIFSLLTMFIYRIHLCYSHASLILPSVLLDSSIKKQYIFKLFILFDILLRFCSLERKCK